MGDVSRLVLHGGPVRTMDPAHPVGRALVLAGDRIEAVLDDPADAPRGAERIDLAGGCVLPAFTDAHVHFPSWALARRELDLLGARSVADAAARVAARAPSGGWVRGRGWREGLWPPGDVPSASALRADVPVMLRAHDGHSLWVNGPALALAEGDLETPGGVVERHGDGTPTGILREEAAWRFELRFAPQRGEVLAAMRAALPAVAAAGVVALHDKDGDREAPALFAALGPLPFAVWQSIPAHRLDAEHDRADYVKAFMDGTLGSRTARLLDGSGVEITSTAGLAEIIQRAAAFRLPVAVHAIGDQANRDALDAFAATADTWRPLGLRPRIEHAQCVHPEDVPRFAALRVTASVQYTHATSDRDLADRLWGERAAHSYPYGALLAAGARLAGGSDAPVEPLDPLAGLRAAVLRTDGARPPWRAEHAIGLDAALASFTAVPAWLEGAEGRRGTLRAGLAADLVVLDRDPFADLVGARVAGTMRAGAWLIPPGSE
jgi:predicted amidohydrolase YtcJ